jgi:hypothetical protein
MDRSDLPEPVVTELVSATEPKFAAVLGAGAITVTVIDSSAASAAAFAAVAESTVTATLTNAAAVVVSEPTIVNEVSPFGPTETANELADSACAGEAATSNPKPNAATVASEMRLNIVFVDIDFLSLVDLETISRSAW